MSWCMCGGCERCMPAPEPDDDDREWCGVCGEPADECVCVPFCSMCERESPSCICDDYVDSPELFDRVTNHPHFCDCDDCLNRGAAL